MKVNSLRVNSYVLYPLPNNWESMTDEQRAQWKREKEEETVAALNYQAYITDSYEYNRSPYEYYKP